MLLELLTYRRTGHSRRDACHYQPKEEREEWFGRDPIDRFGQMLLRAQGIADAGRPRRDPDRASSAEFQAAVEAAPARSRCPTLDDLTTDVFA